MNDFGARLKQSRLGLGITQQEAAERVRRPNSRQPGISQSEWARYERGTIIPSVVMAGRLAAAVGKDLCELIEGDENA